MSKSMTAAASALIPAQRAGAAVIDDSLCGDDLTMGLESMQIGASGYPAVVLVNENGVIRYHCATEMSTEELRALVTQAAAGLAVVDANG